MWGRQIAKDTRKLHRVMEISHNLTGMVVTWVYTIVKINPTVHLGLTCLIVCKLYFKTNVSFKKKIKLFSGASCHIANIPRKWYQRQECAIIYLWDIKI